MAISLNCYSITPSEYDIFCGLDVDKTSVSITVVDHTQRIRSFKMPNNADIIINYAKNHFNGKRIAFAYEAGPTGYGLYDRLSQAGYTCLVVAASMVPTPAGRQVKTNRIDSVYIANALRSGQLNSIRVPSRIYRDLRHLTQIYKVTTKQNAKCKVRIKALLLHEGMPFPYISKNNQWSNATIKRLELIGCLPAIRFKLDMLLTSMRFHRQQLLTIKKALRHFCNNDPDLADSVRFLLSIPGIGWIIAAFLLARIGDWRHLKNVRELAGFIGLTPRENSTGEEVRKGGITHSGDAYLRSILIEGAWSAITKDPELFEFYRQVYNRHPRDRAARKAIVAVARKLTTRIYAVLTERRLYKIRYKQYNETVQTSHRKRRLLHAPKDASTTWRTDKCVSEGADNLCSPALTGSSLR